LLGKEKPTQRPLSKTLQLLGLKKNRPQKKRKASPGRDQRKRILARNCQPSKNKKGFVTILLAKKKKRKLRRKGGRNEKIRLTTGEIINRNYELGREDLSY